MNLAEYFRLPKHQRLTRRAIAFQLTARGHKITSAGVAYWVRHGVPRKWRGILLEIINDQLQATPGSPCVEIDFAIDLPSRMEPYECRKIV